MASMIAAALCPSVEFLSAAKPESTGRLQDLHLPGRCVGGVLSQHDFSRQKLTGINLGNA